MTASFRPVPGPEGLAAEPVFAEPWQAQAFAITVQLHQRGLFSWTEWTQALAQQIARAPSASPSASASAADDAAVYYRHWLAALEHLVVHKGATSTKELSRCAHAWTRAAGRTPHGQPIVLQRNDFDADGAAH